MDTRFRPLVRPYQLVFKHSSRPTLDKPGTPPWRGEGGGRRTKSSARRTKRRRDATNDPTRDNGGRNQHGGRNSAGRISIPNRIFSSLDIEKLDRCQRLSGFSNDTRFGKFSSIAKKIHKYRKFYRKYSYIYYCFWRLSV